VKFWDASALIPLYIEGPQTKAIRAIAKADGDIVAWWGSPIECFSAFARLRREGFLRPQEEDQIRHLLVLLTDAWTEIEPSAEVRVIAARLLLAHPLRAADSLQLAAGLVWAGTTPRGHHFICLDRRLRDAARAEGFALLPA
jgi:predicted nucleic acid-binding protein